MTTTTTYRASFPLSLIKTAESKDGKRGKAKALVSAYDEEYELEDGTHIIRSDSLKLGADPVSVFWQHDWAAGARGKPVGHAHTSNSDAGILVDAEFYLDTEGGRSVYNALKAKALREWSVGYTGKRKDDGTVYDGELIEASVVLKGANPGTKTLDVANRHDTTAHRRTVDDIASKHGFGALSADDIMREARQAPDRRRRIAEALGSNGPMTAASFDVLRADMVEHVATGHGSRSWQLSWQDTETFLAAIAPTTGHPEFLGRPSHQPVPLSPLDLIPQTRHVEGHVKQPRISRSSAAAPTAFGTAAPDVGYTATGDAEQLGRVPVTLTSNGDVVSDSGVGLESVLRALRDGTRQGLGSALVDATGVVENITGIKNVVGIQTLDASALAEVVALSRSARMVHDAGFSGPLAVVANPAVADEVLLGSVRDEVPSIVAYLASNHLAAGEYVIGDWTAGSELFIQPTLINSSVSHVDNYVTGKVTFMAETRAFPSWKEPTAFVHVTGVS